MVTGMTLEEAGRIGQKAVEEHAAAAPCEANLLFACGSGARGCAFQSDLSEMREAKW